LESGRTLFGTTFLALPLGLLLPERKHTEYTLKTFNAVQGNTIPVSSENHMQNIHTSGRQSASKLYGEISKRKDSNQDDN
jgi:hypothetical protein